MKLFFYFPKLKVEISFNAEQKLLTAPSNKVLPNSAFATVGSPTKPSSLKSFDIHPKETELDNTDDEVKAIGLGHATGGPQVMLDDQPAALIEALEVNTKVKLPSGALEVITGGKVVPEKAPIKLAGETVPLYIFKTSLFNSVLKEVNVTVTTSPIFVGFTTVVPVAAVVLPTESKISVR